MNTHIHLLSALLFVGIMTTSVSDSYSQSNQSNETKIQEVINNGYFEYISADNDETTRKNYLAARETFAKQNPEKYAELVNQETEAAHAKTKKHYIDPVEFESMPDEKRQEIIANPEKYQVGPLSE